MRADCISRRILAPMILIVLTVMTFFRFSGSQIEPMKNFSIAGPTAGRMYGHYVIWDRIRNATWEAQGVPKCTGGVYGRGGKCAYGLNGRGHQNPEILSSTSSAQGIPHRNHRIAVPSVVVRPNRGIGNQLFQYACSYAVARSRNLPLYVWIHPEELTSSNMTKRNFTASSREYALDYFGIPVKGANVFSDDVRYSLSESDVHGFTEMDVLNGDLPNDKVLILSDLCISEVFFSVYKDEIRQLFNLNHIPLSKSSQGFLRQIENAGADSVAVHIRRGDFLAQQHRQVPVPIGYQKTAMELMAAKLQALNNMTQHGHRREPTFFIFSDDIDYVKEQFVNFSNTFNFVFVSGPDTTSLEEFYLMAHCKHNIIPNSTFSWWAAYLNPNQNKIVIAPYPTHHPNFFEEMQNPTRREHRRKLFKDFPYPETWLRLDSQFDR